MNEVIRAIEERRSVRAYTDKMPEREKIEEVITSRLQSNFNVFTVSYTES